MGISLSQTWLYISKIIMGCYLCLGIWYWIGSYKVTHEENHHHRVVYPCIRNGLGQSRLYIGKIFIGCYLCLGNDRSSHLLEWMNGGLHAYLHPYISTPMYIYTIHSPIPYHIRQWGNFNPNTQYPITNTTQHHGEISQTNLAPVGVIITFMMKWKCQFSWMIFRIS